ncbi:MAG: molecular chaperone Tir [Eubacteriales bacterium]|nr:molecular chaperone Tir [Eubacteriales bacterium]
MYYRTRTYLAGDWDGDSSLIQQIYDWNNNGHLSLDFTDAHDLTRARDGSLNCTIKASLSKRLNASKTFVLIVGDKTNTVTSGSCQHCENYSSYYHRCSRRESIDFRSYVEYECEKAARDYCNNEMKIVVIYNYLSVHRDKCPKAVRDIGTHIAGVVRANNGDTKFDYQTIKNAIM